MLVNRVKGCICISSLFLCHSDDRREEGSRGAHAMQVYSVVQLISLLLLELDFCNMFSNMPILSICFTYSMLFIIYSENSLIPKKL